MGKQSPSGTKSRTNQEIAEIYSRQVNTVYGLCLSIMGNPADAEDAVQLTFMKLMKAPTRFAGPEHEKAWLITTAKNQCRDLHRQWWRKKVSLPGEPVEEAEAPGKAEGLSQAIMALPAKQRVVLYLHYYEGYRLTEISAMLGRNLNTVKTQLRAAKGRLKLELEEDFHEEG